MVFFTCKCLIPIPTLANRGGDTSGHSSIYLSYWSARDNNIHSMYKQVLDMKESQFQRTIVEGVAIADNVIPSHLDERLILQINELSKSQRVDYHPHSRHPHMFLFQQVHNQQFSKLLEAFVLSTTNGDNHQATKELLCPQGPPFHSRQKNHPAYSHG